MAGENSELAAEARDRLVPAPLGAVELLCGMTLFGVLLAAIVGANTEGLFLIATLVALLILRRLQLPPGLEFAFGIGILLQGWGNALLLFERIGWYDKAVHFLTPMLVVPPLCLLLVRAGALAPLWGNGLRRGTLGVFVIMAALGTALAAIWELVEAVADRWLGTSLAHGYLETMDDLSASLFGSLAAGFLLAWLVKHGREPEVEPLTVEALAEGE